VPEKKLSDKPEEDLGPITAEDIFAESAKIGAAKRGVDTEDMFAYSANIGFLNRK
jgi:hypothetical protein